MARLFAQTHQEGLRYLQSRRAERRSGVTERRTAPQRRRRSRARGRGRPRRARAPRPRPRRARRHAGSRAVAAPLDEYHARAHRPRARAARRPPRGDQRARLGGRRAPSIAARSSAPSPSPASATPTSGAARARSSSATRSRWRRSAPGCGSTPRRSARRCCTTPSRTRARASRRSSSEFGQDIAHLVDGVTKLTGITFESRDESQAENYRKMMVAMAADVRVILIKLADRLHNMRTLAALPKQKQMGKARETLEIYAPLAHRLGIHAIKWELEDLAFQILHPRKYEEIKKLVGQQRDEREDYVDGGGRVPRPRAARGRDRGADLRPRQALLLDLLEDDQEGPGVQRDLRPDGDAGDRRLGQGLLRRDRGHPRALEAAARALQGLHRDPEDEPVPDAAHDGDRPAGPAAGDPDPHARRCTSSPSTASPRT